MILYFMIHTVRRLNFIYNLNLLLCARINELILIPSSFWQYEVVGTDTIYWCKIFKASSLREKHHMIGVSQYTAMQILANRFLK